LRTLPETFAFFVKLTQNIETRSFFRQRMPDCGQTFFSVGYELLMLS
jgi:hypothetical protein